MALLGSELRVCLALFYDLDRYLDVRVVSWRLVRSCVVSKRQRSNRPRRICRHWRHRRRRRKLGHGKLFHHATDQHGHERVRAWKQKKYDEKHRPEKRLKQKQYDEQHQEEWEEVRMERMTRINDE